MRRVEHPDLGFAFEIPDAWQTAELPEGLAVAPADDPEELGLPPGFAVTLAAFGDGEHDAASLSDQALMHEARWLTDLHLLDAEDVELPGGIPARRTLATYRQGIASLTLEQWHAARDGRALVLSAVGPTEDQAVLHDLWQAMVDSLAVGE